VSQNLKHPNNSSSSHFHFENDHKLKEADQTLRGYSKHSAVFPLIVFTMFCPHDTIRMAALVLGSEKTSGNIREMLFCSLFITTFSPTIGGRILFGLFSPRVRVSQ
jgi:hypothetical protein